MFGRRSFPRVLVLVAAAAVLMLAFATSAFAVPVAGPDVPIMRFGDLRSVLTTAPGHQLSGYMKTVVDSSQEPTTIPLTVLGVPATGTPDKSLIMFEATGPLIAKYGGIVAGMSGSPVYLDTGELIGAVSYGDQFTLGGTGLATPIEAMTEIENSYISATVPLSTPLITSNGLFNKIILAPDPQNYAGAAAAGAFVAKPLASVFIGGLKPESSGYKKLATDLKARGISVVALDAPLVSGGGDENFAAIEMTAGASVAALASRGDMWVGGVGTITYVDGANVLAYGHPAYWSGATSLYMANASIEGIWPSRLEPYKVADPGKIRGAITQDRSAGIMGKIDVFPTETTITATAINIDPDAVTHETTSAVYVPRQLLTNGFADSSLVGAAAYVAGSNLFNQAGQPGSAHTTTTVKVADGHGTEYDISIPNYTDSTYDIAGDATNDVVNAINSLQSVLGWGTETLKILSVDVTGEYSAHRTGATIVGVEAPNGLHIGPNHLIVKAVAYGVDDTASVDATLVIPAGAALGGSLTASALNSGGSDLSSIFADSGISLSVNNSSGRQTIAQIAASLKKTLPNTTIQITFQPSFSGFSGNFDPSQQPPSTDPISLNVTAPWPVSSQADVGVTTIDARALPSIISYGDFADISGTVNGPSTATVVSLYAKAAGSSTEALVAKQTVKPIDGSLDFDFPIDQVFTNTTYRVHVDGTDSWTAANTSVSLQIRANLNFSASASRIKPGKTVKLAATAYPATTAGGTVVFEQLVGRSWRRITSKTLASSGSFAKASLTWKPSKGTHKTRARYLGGLKNAATTSSTRTITVK